MRRREFITGLGGVVAWPLRAIGQQAPVVGFLNGQSPSNFGHLVTSFHEGLSEGGYVEGRNLTIEYRWGDGQLARAPALATELVNQKVAVIVATGGAHLAAKAATSTIPIICSIGSDPIKEGLVSSINRPGGNITGVSVFSASLEAKRLELLDELMPTDALVGVVIDFRIQCG